MWSKEMNPPTQGHTLVSNRSWMRAQRAKLLLPCLLSVLLLPCHRKASSLFGSEVHHARGKPVSLLETGSRKLYLYHEIVVILGFNDVSNELVDTLLSELFPRQQQSLHC